MPPRHYTQARGRTQYLSSLRLKPSPVEGTVGGAGAHAQYRRYFSALLLCAQTRYFALY